MSCTYTVYGNILQSFQLMQKAYTQQKTQAHTMANNPAYDPATKEMVRCSYEQAEIQMKMGLANLRIQARHAHDKNKNTLTSMDKSIADLSAKLAEFRLNSMPEESIEHIYITLKELEKQRDHFLKDDQLLPLVFQIEFTEPEFDDLETGGSMDLSSGVTIGTGNSSVQSKSLNGSGATRRNVMRGVVECFKNTVLLDYNAYLGQGGFGQVFQGKDVIFQRDVAVKEVVVKHYDTSTLDELKHEYDIIKSLHHNHIVQVYDFELTEGYVRLSMEFMGGGSLEGMLKRTGLFTEESAAQYMKQALQGLAFLHDNNIIHRDLKPGNILVDSIGCTKISDFGTARFSKSGQGTTTKSVLGTVVYLAPECVRGKYSKASDVWAMGCSLLHLISGLPPWHHLHSQEPLSLLFHLGTMQAPDHLPEIPADMSSAGLDFVMKCLAFDASDRPSALELLQHPFITSN